MTDITTTPDAVGADLYTLELSLQREVNSRFAANAKDEGARPQAFLVCDFEYLFRRDAFDAWCYVRGAECDDSGSVKVPKIKWPFHTIAAASWMVMRFDGHSAIPQIEPPVVMTLADHEEIDILKALFAALDALGDTGRMVTSLLSPEGHAVLLMLASTRKPNLAPLPIGLPTLESFHGLADNPTEDERERLIAEQEKAARHLRYQFTRQDLGGQPAIVLSGIGLGPNIPLTRVLWSMTFMDSYARDRTLFWMHERIDRWLDWGELAYRKGARAFTEHLLQLAFADKLIDTAS